MKRSLHIKVAILLGYVALCTMLVVADDRAADGAAPGGQFQAADFE